MVVFFGNPLNMDPEDSQEETQGVRSEINRGTDFNLKRAETGEKRFLLCWQNKEQI